MTPTRVALYTHATDPPTRIALFHYAEEDGVTLETLDPDWARLAQRYFTRGVDLYEEKRMVLPAEGPLFMRTLLNQHAMTYYALLDESPT